MTTPFSLAPCNTTRRVRQDWPASRYCYNMQWSICLNAAYPQQSSKYSHNARSSGELQPIAQMRALERRLKRAAAAAAQLQALRGQASGLEAALAELAALLQQQQASVAGLERDVGALKEGSDAHATAGEVWPAHGSVLAIYNVVLSINMIW